MAARALITGNPPRALYAAGVLALLVGALLGAWFYAGWHDVRRQQQEIYRAPWRAADDRAAALARELSAELDALTAREIGRPYFHYQNLMHDPNASLGLNVSPSPLARGPQDEFVLGYFQLDAKGRVSTPTINDDVPRLSDPEHLAANTAFRAQVRQDLSPQIVPTLPAALAPVVGPGTRSDPTPSSRPQAQGSPLSTEQLTQVIQLDSKVYSQNLNSNTAYVQQTLPFASPPPAANVPAAPVTITITPLEWRTLPFAGRPALVAIRQVQTPDETFAQGFVVNPSTLADWLTVRTAGMVAEIRPGDSAGAQVVPGWGLAVSPDPQRLAQAEADAQAIARTFLIQFAAIGFLAAGAAGFVVVLVRRAESLARERSRFAAAAAHELRTPLASLQLYGDLLADDLGDPGKTRDYARRMSEEASRLGRVVSNVLAFSHLERDHRRLDAPPGPLTDALREIAERAQHTLNRAGATLALDLPPGLHACFDRDAVARIAGNLIDNAEKYARDAADRTIRLSARQCDGAVEVTIEDRGPGVTDASKLFQPFSRGASGNESPAGLGLGLALSRSQARAMGGELTYRPRDGGGAAFVLRLRSEETGCGATNRGKDSPT